MDSAQLQEIAGGFEPRRMRRLVPNSDRVIIKPSDEVKKVGSIFIPDAAQERPVTGTIVGVGPGLRSRDTGELIPVDFKVGDEVVFGKYAGTPIKVDTKGDGVEEIFFVLRAPDVYASFTEE